MLIHLASKCHLIPSKGHPVPLKCHAVPLNKSPSEQAFNTFIEFFICLVTDLSIDDIDVYKINEAFGSQAVYCVEHLGIPMSKVGGYFVVLKFNP